MNPVGACFEVGPKGYFSFEPQFASTRMWTALGAFSGFVEKSTVFDREGCKWRASGVQAPFRKSWWRVLLAHSIYNPRVSVTIVWSSPKAYQLEELKEAYLSALDRDDDILTQFVEADVLRKKICEAQTFDGLAEVYRWMQTDHVDEKTLPNKAPEPTPGSVTPRATERLSR